MKADPRLLVGFLLLTYSTGLHAQSPDPLDDWQIVATPAVPLRGLAYQDGHFVGGGVTTNIVVSSDGVNWSVVPSSVTNSQAGFLAVTEGAGKFVAVGAAGLIASSSDGLHWTHLRTDFHDEYWAVTYAGGQFVAVGFRWEHNIATAVAVTSVDGAQWQTYLQSFSTTPRNVAYGNGLYVAVGSPVSMYSTNGQNWTPLNGVLAQGIAYGGGQFIATTLSTGYRSSNGVDWTQIDLPVLAEPHQNYYTAAYANGLFIIGGFCDSCPNANRPSLLATSPDGKQWTSRLFGAEVSIGPIRDIIFVDGAYYLADQWGRIWKSGRTSPVAAPVITRVASEGGRVDLAFTAPAGFHYTLESTSRLDVPDWKKCVGPVLATGGEVRLSDTDAMQPARFYRVRME